MGAEVGAALGWAVRQALGWRGGLLRARPCSARFNPPGGRTQQPPHPFSCRTLALQDAKKIVSDTVAAYIDLYVPKKAR